MEPALDPAQEAQAAGRIHRLGQTKEIHIKRFGFRASIDEAIASLHDKVKSGQVVIVDKTLPKEALQHFLDHRVAKPHVVLDSEDSVTVVQEGHSYAYGAGYGDGRAYDQTQPGGLPVGVKLPDPFGFTYRLSNCTVCGKEQEVPDSLVWWGEGNMTWLTGHTGEALQPAEAIYRNQYPKRPLTLGEAAALPGNDPSQRQATEAILAEVGVLRARAKVVRLEKRLKDAEASRESRKEAEAAEKENDRATYDQPWRKKWWESFHARNSDEIESLKKQLAKVKEELAQAEKAKGGGGASSSTARS